jgi:hypothetical protein
MRVANPAHRMNRIALAFSQCRPVVLPANYSSIDEYDNAARFIRSDAMTVISEVAEYQNRLWLHVSCAHADKLPSWSDLREVKTVFCGPKRLALSILPSEAEYVNIHPYVLHLWCPLDHDPIPDFRRYCAVTGKDAI